MKVLFIEKVFLRRKKGDLPLRGVELFNLFLARDLVRAGAQVTLPAGRSWAGTIEAPVADARPDWIWVRHTGLDFLNALLAAGRAGRRRHDALLLGNVGDSLLPALRWLRARRAYDRCVLIAHREASPAFVRAMAGLTGHILAVNEQIAAPFRAAGGPPVAVDYGIMNADAFYPRPQPKPDAEGVNFCVLGHLDNAWKGADTAVAAFRRLPEALRARCRLHLVSYLNPPVFPEPHIVAAPWLDIDAIPALLREMDVLLVPSRDEEVMRETFSQAIVQGMLTGLPIIASGLPILAEKLNEGGGRIYRTEDELVSLMAELAGSPALRRRLGAEGRRVALARYVWSSRAFMEKYLLA
jgi:glycosyltransferase involved in cell wall biosynthesis